MALTDSLIYSYELDEASGNALDSHASLTLTDVNTVGSGTGLVHATARDFESGSTEYFERSSEAALQAGDIDCTWEAWMQLESLGAHRTVMGKSGASNFAYDIQFRTDSGGLFFFRLASGSGFAGLTQLSASTFGAPSTATWYQIIAWHDSVGNTMNICVNNGTADSTSYSGGIYVDSDSFRVGNNAYSEYWDGLLGPVRFWKRVLTSGERTSLYNAGAGLTYAGLSGGSGSVFNPYFYRHISGGSSF